MLIKFMIQTKTRSIERRWVELPELVQATVPVVKDLVEVDEVHSDLLDEVLTELILIYIYVHICYFWVLWLESIEESWLLVELFLVNFEYYLADFSAKTCCFFAVILLGMLEEGCASVESCQYKHWRGVGTEVDALDGHLGQQYSHFT